MTEGIKKPTITEMLAVWREDYEEGEWEHIHDRTTGSWRHGSEKEFVARRLSDGTYWCVRYRTTPGADYNDFREGDLDGSSVMQVEPKTVPVTRYLPVEVKR